jgi:RHS repeat-associated protein
MTISQITGYLASSLTGTGLVTATSSGTSITITANATGTNTNYTLTPSWTSSSSSGGYSLSFPGALSGGTNSTYDSGTVRVIVDGYTATASYGNGSTASSVASSLFTSLSGSGSPVTPSGTNPIGLTSIATGSNSDYSGTAPSASTNGFSPPSFSATPASFTFTGGANAGYTYDTGTVSVTVGTFTATVSYGSSDTPITVASNLANYFNTTSGSPVTAQTSGATVSLTTVTTGAGENVGYSGASQTSQSGTFSSASFSASTQGLALTGGTNTTESWSINTPYVTLYNYDALGNLLCVEQHGGVTSTTGCSSPAGSSDATSPYRLRRFTYDSLSRLTSSENPETFSYTGRIFYTYDANSNLATKTSLSPNQPAATSSPTSVTTTYMYDADNRLTGKTYVDGYSGSPATPPVQYGYDGVALTGCAKAPPSLTDTYPIGRRTSMCDGSSTVPGSGSTSWTHDSMGRVLTDKHAIASIAAKAVNYVYNLDGSTYKVTTPDGRTVVYAPGGAGRPLSALDGDGDNFVKSATYAPPGELQSLIDGGVIYRAFSYNSRLQPLQIFYGTNTPPTLTSSTCPSTVGNIMHRVYGFNFGSSDNGNVLSISNCLTTTRSESFTYDALNRIASAESSGPQWGENYTIDAWGNLTNIGGISGKTYSETLNAAPATDLNQLTGYGYDTAGNMITNASTTYVYDAENRLVWSTGGYRYLYDGDGNRVEKCVAGGAGTGNPCPTSGTNGTLYWMGTGSAALDESDLSGNLLEQYVFFYGTRVARRDVSTDAINFYFSDHLGTHAVVENATGTACEQDIDYYPYGGVEEDYCSTPVAQHYKFNGKERDTESGLDDFVARYDSSNLGRFMTPDWAAKPTAVPYAHFGNPQSLNLYSYVENNPTTFGDPDGHVPWGWGGLGGGCEGTAEQCQQNKQQEWGNAFQANAQKVAAQNKENSSKGGGFWHRLGQHFGNLFSGHSWNFGMRESVTTRIVTEVREPNAAVTAATDAAGIVAAVKDVKGLGYASAAVSVANDHSTQNITINVLGFIPGLDVPIAINGAFIDAFDYKMHQDTPGHDKSQVIPTNVCEDGACIANPDLQPNGGWPN